MTRCKNPTFNSVKIKMGRLETAGCWPRETPHQTWIAYYSEWEGHASTWGRCFTQGSKGWQEVGDPGRDTGQGPRAASPPWSSTGREQRGAGTSLWPARPCPRASRQRTAPVKFPGPATPPAVGKFPWLRGPGLSRLASRGADTAAGPGRVSAGARDAGRPGWARAPIPRTKGPAPAGPGSRARGASEVQVGQSRPLAPGPDAPPGPRLLAQNPTWTPAPARTAARNPVQISGLTPISAPTPGPNPPAPSPDPAPRPEPTWSAAWAAPQRGPRPQTGVPGSLGARREQGAARVAVSGASTRAGAGSDPSRAQRTAPGPALPARPAARAQSGPGRRRDPPPRPIRPRIFPLAGRPGAARQPAPIGRTQGDAGLP